MPSQHLVLKDLIWKQSTLQYLRIPNTGPFRERSCLFVGCMRHGSTRSLYGRSPFCPQSSTQRERRRLTARHIWKTMHIHWSLLCTIAEQARSIVGHLNSWSVEEKACSNWAKSLDALKHKNQHKQHPKPKRKRLFLILCYKYDTTVLWEFIMVTAPLWASRIAKG